MAKELPYFKFEPSEWLEGEIQVCSDISIVCFTNLCSGYWLKLGCISYAFALHKYFRKDANIMQELVNNKIISLNEDKISISFLDRQLNEFKELSDKRTKAANKRWELQENNANAMQVHSKSNAIREDKTREEKKKENIIIIDNTFFSNECKNSEQWIETISMQSKIKIDVVKIFLDTFESHLITMEEQKKTLKDFKEHFSHWIKKQNLSNFSEKKIGKTNQI